MHQLTEKEKLAREKLCIPLDVSSTRDAMAIVDNLEGYAKTFKIGQQLYRNSYAEGINIFRWLKHRNLQSFEDLKYGDKDDQNYEAVKGATKYGVDFLTVHASFGYGIIKSVVRGAEDGANENNVNKPKVLAVTVLTSLDQNTLNKQLRMPGSVEERVLLYAKIAENAGADGIVCSAGEIPVLKQNLLRGMIYATPGISTEQGFAAHDQKRVYTAGQAVKNGASLVIVGTAITKIMDLDFGETVQAAPLQMQENAYKILQAMAKHL